MSKENLEFEDLTTKGDFIVWVMSKDDTIKDIDTAIPMFSDNYGLSEYCSVYYANGKTLEKDIVAMAIELQNELEKKS